MTIKYDPKVREARAVNIIDDKNPELVRFNLEPIYAEIFPSYFTPSGHIAYSLGNGHIGSSLAWHINLCFERMLARPKERIENISFYYQGTDFVCYRGNVYYNSIRTYELFPYILKEIEAYLGQEVMFVPIAFDGLEPQKQIEAWDNFKKQLGEKYPESIGLSVNLTAEEELFRDYSSHCFLHTDPKELSYFTVVDMIRYSNNIGFNPQIIREFGYGPKIKGIYNKAAVDLLNSFIIARRDMCQKMHEICRASNDPGKTVEKLLQKFNYPHDYDRKKPMSHITFLDDGRFCEDLMIYLLGFDKIDRIHAKNPLTTIRTTRINPYEAFFNYLITGDYTIALLDRVDFDPQSNDFITVTRNNFAEQGSEKACEEEIERIKKLVPYSEREKYMI